MTRPTSHVVLLKGVNVGGHNRVAMAGLREALTGAGFGEVATVLQSGNVVLRSDLDAPAVRERVERVLRDDFGVRASVIVRSPTALADALAHDPFAGIGTDGSKYLIGFCSAPPDASAVRVLNSKIGDDFPGGDRYAVVGDLLYQWCPNGVSRSPFFTINFERPLGVTITARNRNTVEKLAALAAD